MFSEQTTQRLRQLQAYILEEPRRFYLDYWGFHVSDSHLDEDPDELASFLNYEVSGDDFVARLTDMPPCGTVACLAGNICVMAGIVKPKPGIGDEEVYVFSNDTPALAAEWLGITLPQRDRLFFPYSSDWTFCWPMNFQKRLNNETPGTIEYAQVGVDRVEYFIETGL